MSGGTRRPGSPPPGSAGRSPRASDAPRRVRHGIRLNKQLSMLREHVHARRWLEIVEPIFTDNARHQGLEYAEAGQVALLVITDGAAEATVQGRAAQPYETRLWMPPLSEDQWSRLMSALASDAGVVAKLLGGTSPAGLLSMSERAHAALLPHIGPGVAVSCTCGAREPCHHAAAVAILVAQRLADDPLTIFDLRGMPAARLLERLRQVRAIQSFGVASAHSDPLIPESQETAASLESSVEDFWRPGPQMAALRREPPAEYAAHALLRRLGPSPLPGKFPLVGLLASIYDAVSDDALRLRDHAEQTEDPG